MQALIATPRFGQATPIQLDAIYHLRYQTFRERLNWEVETANQREKDRYDDLSPVHVMVREGDSVLACARLLPTTGPYMLKDTFPQLLGESRAPELDQVWEISRFAVVKKARPGMNFTQLPAALIRQIIRFAVLNNLSEYVFVTTVAFERLLVRLGVHLGRFAPPQQVGIEKSVALRVFIDEQTILATRANCEIDPFLGPPNEDELKEAQVASSAYQYC